MKRDIELDGITYEVEYSIIPAESEVTYCGDGSGYPGAKREIDLEYIFIKTGIKTGWQLEDEEIINEIKEIITNKENQSWEI